jgi:hypothetical protein
MSMGRSTPSEPEQGCWPDHLHQPSLGSNVLWRWAICMVHTSMLRARRLRDYTRRHGPVGCTAHHPRRWENTLTESRATPKQGRGLKRQNMRAARVLTWSVVYIVTSCVTSFVIKTRRGRPSQAAGVRV